MKIHEISSNTYTAGVQSALVEAQGFMEDSQQALMHPAHMLPGLAALRGITHSVLERLHVTPATLVDTVVRGLAEHSAQPTGGSEDHIGFRFGQSNEDGMHWEIPISESASRAIDLAKEEATRAGIPDVLVGEEHLLMALATLTLNELNDRDGNLASIFGRMGVDPRRIRTITLLRSARRPHVSLETSSDFYRQQVIFATMAEYLIDQDFDLAIAYANGLHTCFHRQAQSLAEAYNTLRLNPTPEQLANPEQHIADIVAAGLKADKYGRTIRTLYVLGQVARDLKESKDSKHGQAQLQTITATLLDIVGRIAPLHSDDFEHCVACHIEVLYDASRHCQIASLAQ